MAAFGFGGFGDMRGGPGGIGGMGLGISRGFEEQYHCYPVSFQDKQHLEAGDKILLPSSALDALARQQVEYPMLFEISNPAAGTRTHCGVLEFSAAEGSCYIPHWMMQNLLLEAGSLLTVKNVSLPKGMFVKFQPQSVDFLDMSNPRAVLETTMRHFSCLTEGDVICIPYNDRKYYLEVKELRPAKAVGIVETDLNVDFDAPVGYDPAAAASAERGGAEGEGTARASGSPSSMDLPAPATGKAVKSTDEASKFVPFGGKGVRVDEKEVPRKEAGAAGGGRGQEGANPGRQQAAAAEARAMAAEARAATREGGSAGASPATRLPTGIKAQPGKWAKSKKLQAGAFGGSGNRMG